MPGELKKKVFFRADGNSRIGLGHIIRSLALAEIISENFHITFLIQSPDDYLTTEIRKVCDELIELPTDHSNDAEAEHITSLSIIKCISISGIQRRTWRRFEWTPVPEFLQRITVSLSLCQLKGDNEF
ncbi:MAG: hypothetical protein ABIQ11_12315 [Saprospiraceae bacterium]